jgi:phosphate transport system permease protein
MSSIAPAAPPRLLTAGPRTGISEVLFTGLSGFATLLIVVIVGFIVANIVIGGAGTITWEFLTAPPRDGLRAGGIGPAIFGTVALVLLMVLAVIPFGAMAAIYLHEYSRPESRWTRGVRFAVSNLAGVPSIVFGLFGLGFFIQGLGVGIDRALGLDVTWGQPCMLWAAMTLALLNLPVVIVTTEEALAAVPQHFREASLALGATRWQTIWRVVLPQALPGILTGGILAVGRGAGEVAPILFTGAAYFLPYLPERLTDQFMHLGYHTFVLATQSPDVDATRPVLFGTVLVLLLLTLLLNLTATLIRARTRARARSGG